MTLRVLGRRVAVEMCYLLIPNSRQVQVPNTYHRHSQKGHNARVPVTQLYRQYL